MYCVCVGCNANQQHSVGGGAATVGVQELRWEGVAGGARCVRRGPLRVVDISDPVRTCVRARACVRGLACEGLRAFVCARARVRRAALGQHDDDDDDDDDDDADDDDDD